MGSLSEQSASFPGRLAVSRTDFLLVSSLAFLAASLALYSTMGRRAGTAAAAEALAK